MAAKIPSGWILTEDHIQTDDPLGTAVTGDIVLRCALCIKREDEEATEGCRGCPLLKATGWGMCRDCRSWERVTSHVHPSPLCRLRRLTARAARDAAWRPARGILWQIAREKTLARANIAAAAT